MNADSVTSRGQWDGRGRMSSRWTSSVVDDRSIREILSYRVTRLSLLLTTIELGNRGDLIGGGFGLNDLSRFLQDRRRAYQTDVRVPSVGDRREDGRVE